MSGLKEDLGFEGNQLVQLQTMYTVGAVVGQIPFMFLFTFIPMNYIIPFLDICWGIFTLLQYRATGFAEMAAYRFLVGWFEVRLSYRELRGRINRVLTYMSTGVILSCYTLHVWCMVPRR